MLSTDFVAIVVGILAVAVVFLAYQVVLLSRDLDSAVDFVRKHNAKSLSLSKIADLEVSLTELTDSYNALLASHKKLRSRIGMREKRERDKNDGNGYDPTDEAQKSAYKARMRADLRARGLI